MLLIVAGAALLSACDPIGSVDRVVASADGTGVVVTGWAIDEETPEPIDVTVAVAGGTRVRVRADLDRPDVARHYPGSGSRHGYRVNLPAAEGEHTVCVAAHHVGGGRDTLLGCRNVKVPLREPRGNLEAAAVGPGVVRFSGWAADPDAPGPTTVVIVDPTDRNRIVGTGTADMPRPDAARTSGSPQAGGFAIDVPVSEAGPRRFCAIARNQRAGADRSLGCRDVDIPDRRPLGRVSAVRVDGPLVTLEGTATDPDGGTPTVRFADWSANEGGFAGATVPVSGGTWSVTFSRPDGTHRFCPVLVDTSPTIGIAGDRALPCAWATIGTVELATPGAVEAIAGVGSNNPAMRTADRDAGVSVSLRDGSTLWLFGDTTTRGADGRLVTFTNGTAAWAPKGAELEPRDGTDTAGRPFRLATPGAGFGTCPAARPTRAMWVTSAVVVPNGARDRVIVWLANMCLGAGWDAMEPRGMAVADWTYDPANPPANRAIQLNIREQMLFGPGERSYGTAAAFDGTWVYAYQCDPLGTPGGSDCRIARVLPANAHVRGAYEYLTSDGWSSDAAAAAPMDLPGAQPGTAHMERPISSFTIARDDRIGNWIMAYSPWPGLGGEGAIRVAPTPLGPWSPPVGITFPDCQTRVGTTTLYCYAVSPQPWRSATGRLGVGIYDQATPLNSNFGRYVVGTVPLTVSERDG